MKEVVLVQKLFRCTVVLYCTVPLHYESLLYSSIMYATGLIFLCSKEHVGNLSFKKNIKKNLFSFTHLMTNPHTNVNDCSVQTAVLYSSMHNS